MAAMWLRSGSQGGRLAAVVEVAEVDPRDAFVPELLGSVLEVVGLAAEQRVGVGGEVPGCRAISAAWASVFCVTVVALLRSMANASAYAGSAGPGRGRLS
jgi:hypothetical protein